MPTCWYAWNNWRIDFSIICNLGRTCFHCSFPPLDFGTPARHQIQEASGLMYIPNIWTAYTADQGFAFLRWSSIGGVGSKCQDRSSSGKLTAPDSTNSFDQINWGRNWFLSSETQHFWDTMTDVQPALPKMIPDRLVILTMFNEPGRTINWVGKLLTSWRIQLGNEVIEAEMCFETRPIKDTVSLGI